jgi:porin
VKNRVARHRLGLVALALLAATSFTGVAHAQLQRDEPSEAVKPPAQPGPLAPLAPTLDRLGINIRSELTDEYASSLAGGVKKGEDNVGQIYLGIDLDLQKELGIKGGSFHVTIYNDFGKSEAKDYTGTLVKQQENFKNAFPKAHLGLVSYEQKLFDDKFDIIVGHLGSTAYFGHTMLGCYFQNGSTCGIPTVLNSEGGFTLLPSATWGVNTKTKTSANTSLDIGIFEINPTQQPSNGLNFNTEHATGVTGNVEFAYAKTDLKKYAYPEDLKIGYYGGNGTRPDVYYNTKGTSLGTFGGTAASATGLRQGAYIMGDKTVWRPDPSRTQNLSLMLAFMQPFEHEEVVDREIASAAVLRGPWRVRPDDTIGLEFTYFHVSQGEQNFLNDARVKAGGSRALTTHPDEFLTELNYGIQLNHATRLTPNIQYIINPDNSQIAKINFVPKNLVVVGLKLIVNVPQLLGLPSRPLGAE